MGIYDPLNCFLAESSRKKIQMPFAEIERLLGRTLPKSAYTYNAWWANGGHSQASAWLDAGYKVSVVDFSGKMITFIKAGSARLKKAPVAKAVSLQKPAAQPAPFLNADTKTIQVCGYTFSYLQDLIPDCDSTGSVIKYYPQNGYDNKKGLQLSYHGKGAFCRFSIQAENWPGVYLWVLDGQIIYIGETAGLRQRFNMGYGYISPRNCYVGGQSTNCKMNKVILSNYERGKTVSLYFYQTTDYKHIELDLLNQIYTPYNVKDN